MTQIKKVDAPNPGWKPGSKQSHPFPSDEMITLIPEEVGPGAMYPFIISSIVPRPVAFIVSESKKGVINLSPYSYFNFMSQDPPVFCIGTCSTAPTEKRPSYMKDSQQNIVDTGEFTLNMISEWFVEAANHTCGNYDPEIDELALAGFETVPSTQVKPPRLRESVVHFECKLLDTYDIKNKKGDITSTIVIGEVLVTHVNKHVTTKTGHDHIVVDLEKYAPVSRCGGVSYARVSEYYDIPRPPKECQDNLKDSK